MTREGLVPVKSLYKQLLQTEKMSVLTPSKAISSAASDHIKDHGPKGKMGHYSSNGASPFDRMNKYGKILDTAGENIHYGRKSAKYILIDLLIDDGVPGRGHRENILNPAFKKTGVAIGPHSKIRYMAVIDYAGRYDEKK
jgi:uncharacterized protein YkwD